MNLFVNFQADWNRYLFKKLYCDESSVQIAFEILIFFRNRYHTPTFSEEFFQVLLYVSTIDNIIQKGKVEVLYSSASSGTNDKVWKSLQLMLIYLLTCDLAS